MKIRIIVLNEHTLGYIHPGDISEVQFLHSSILRGSPFGIHQTSAPIRSGDTIRLATSDDFNEYRVSEVGYRVWKGEYEYIRL
jgi:hypothetical protein